MTSPSPSRPHSPSPSPSPSLRELTDTIRQRAGVRAAVIVGNDGLVIEAPELMQSDAELLAARVPAVVTSAHHLGSAADAGDTQLALLEYDGGYAVILVLSAQALLFVATTRDVRLGELLFDVRRHRSAMAALV